MHYWGKIQKLGNVWSGSLPDVPAAGVVYSNDQSKVPDLMHHAVSRYKDAGGKMPKGVMYDGDFVVSNL